MMQPDRTIRTTTSQWAVLGVALLVLGAVIALNQKQEYDRTAQHERERLLAQTQVIALNTERQLESAKLVLEDVRQRQTNWHESAGVQEGLHDLRALVSAMPGVRTINVLDREGTLRFSNRSELLGQNFSYRDYFQTIRQHPSPDTLYVSPPFRTVLGEFAINISRMIPGPRGEFDGIVSATLDPAYFQTLMSSVLYAPDIWDAIAHGDGALFLMVPARGHLHGTNLAQPGSFFTRHLASGKPATVMSGKVYSTGEMRMMAQRTINPPQLLMDKPLVVAVSRDLDGVFQTWRHDAIAYAALYALIALISITSLLTHQQRRRKSEQRMAEALALANRFSLALDHIPTYIYMKDRQHRYVYANKPTLELFKCTEEQLRGSEDARFFPPATVAKLYEIDTRVLDRGEDTAEEIVSQADDGSQRVYWEIKTPIYDEQDKSQIWGLCGISTDITELKALQEKLAIQAHQDYLTGLSNRRFFLEQGETELARAQRYGNTLSLFMLDIDHFKVINDTHGHKAGDLVLQRLSQIMRETLRTVDLIGRIGGEEFAVLLPETNLQAAFEVAERLREKIATSDVILEGGLPLRFTVSIGITALQPHDTNLDILLNEADRALYRAKSAGRNQVCAAG